ncbi:MAG: TIR domain-containing protein, partial [Anaerolineae bacterium]
MTDDLIRRLEDALNRAKNGDPDALDELRALLTTDALDIKVGDIADSTAVAIGKNIHLVVNQSNLPDDLLVRLDTLLRQPTNRAAIEAQQSGGHIFLSYSRKDAQKAQQIRAALEDAGHTVWQDITALKGGSEWVDSIERGIDSCYTLVSVVSTDANLSKWVRIEYLHAERRDKHIVPIKIDDSEIPTMMLTTHVIFADEALQAGITHLLEVLPAPPEGEAAVQAQQATADRRTLEIAYLDSVLLEHSVWQTVYTPMAGVAQIRRRERDNGKPKMVTTPTSIQSKFKRRLEKAKLSPEVDHPPEEREFDDILPAVEAMLQLVILGDPGSGKTTTLWRIAADTAERAKADPSAPLPVFVRMGEMGQYATLEAAIRDELGALAEHYDALVEEGRLALLLDGLNELPKENRTENAQAARALEQRAQEAGTVAVVTCRELDYTGPLDLGIDDRVTVEPLDPVRIHRFIEGYITEPEEAASQLFWPMAGEEALNFWQRFQNKVGETFAVFWLASQLPEGKKWGQYSWETYTWDNWLKRRAEPRSMLQLATNPFMLYMITQVYTEEGELPANRGALFDLFTDFLLEDREKLTPQQAATIQDELAALGYAMQAEGEGTTFSLAQVTRHLTGATSLYHAKSASILTGDDELRFTHQLLQEYFAARHLRTQMEAGVPATQLFPPESWWEPQGWEETCILLAGLYSDDPTRVVTWLREAQPEVAARCITESGATAPPDETLLSLRPLWIPRLTDLQNDPQPKARAAVGRALGRLRLEDGQPLDNRPGVGLDANVLPDIA